jgi:hypothetical protein
MASSARQLAKLDNGQGIERWCGNGGGGSRNGGRLPLTNHGEGWPRLTPRCQAGELIVPVVNHGTGSVACRVGCDDRHGKGASRTLANVGPIRKTERFEDLHNFTYCGLFSAPVLLGADRPGLTPMAGWRRAFSPVRSN